MAKIFMADPCFPGEKWWAAGTAGGWSAGSGLLGGKLPCHNDCVFCGLLIVIGPQSRPMKAVFLIQADGRGVGGADLQREKGQIGSPKAAEYV